jgi:hypothetical protein
MSGQDAFSVNYIIEVLITLLTLTRQPKASVGAFLRIPLISTASSVVVPICAVDPFRIPLITFFLGPTLFTFGR